MAHQFVSWWREVMREAGSPWRWLVLWVVSLAMLVLPKDAPPGAAGGREKLEAGSRSAHLSVIG